MLIFAIKISIGHIVQMCIGPPDFIREVVDGQGVWPGQVVSLHRGHDPRESGVISIHANPANVGLEVPRGEKYVANSRMNHNGSRVFDASHDGFPVPSVQFRNAHMLSMPVDPIEFVVDPIHSNAFKAFGIMFNHGLFLGDVICCNFSFVNRFGRHVSKVDIAIFVVEIQADHVAQVSLNKAHLGRISAHISYVVFVAENDPWINVIQPFAGFAIGLAFVKFRITFAVERPFGIKALLRACTGHVGALVDVLTGLAISHELVAFVAFAPEALLRVDTLVIAAVILDTSAFVNSTVKWFIAAIRTILFFVANQIVAYALFAIHSGYTLALELVFFARILLGITVEFVRTVTTVVFAIASVVFRNAFRVLTGELRVIAFPIVILAIFAFITAISAIVVMVAFPNAVNAPSVIALELIRTAFFQSDVAVRILSLVLISSIDAIRIAVANPVLLDANLPSPGSVRFAGEFRVRIARPGLALPVLALVTVVKAVVVPVANVNPRDAISIVAREQVPIACSLCGFAFFLGLISSTIAIRIAVAVPSRGNAPMIRTPE